MRIENYNPTQIIGDFSHFEFNNLNIKNVISDKEILRIQGIQSKN